MNLQFAHGSQNLCSYDKFVKSNGYLCWVPWIVLANYDWLTLNEFEKWVEWKKVEKWRGRVWKRFWQESARRKKKHPQCQLPPSSYWQQSTMPCIATCKKTCNVCREIAMPTPPFPKNESACKTSWSTDVVKLKTSSMWVLRAWIFRIQWGVFSSYFGFSRKLLESLACIP